MFSDPSGYFSLKKFIRGVVAIAVAVYAPQLSAAMGWTAGVTAQGVAISGGLSGTIGLSGTVASGMLGGALAGGIMGGTFKSALVGGLTGAAFGAVGNAWDAGTFGNIAGHAAVGCASSSLSGGDCGSGALAAGVAAYGSANMPSVLKGNFGYEIAFTSTLGGIASVAGGGKFANGAMTAAFGYIFNYCAHNGCFDRRFDWNDAVDHWKNGNGATVTDVKASELNLKDATYTKNANGTYQIHTSLKYDTGAIYGTVTGVLNVDGTMSIKPDVYNFDQKNPLAASTIGEFGRIMVRNAATASGAAINGFGTPYRIEFTGTVPAPRDLLR
ncbi:hypothetical protein D3C85_557410 [compost metagenome]